MNHSFDVDVANRFGVNEAIFIENLRFWIAKNKANNRHFYDGRFWTYNSAKAFAELFPYWSKQQIERIVQRLKSANILMIGHYSPNTYDRTNWYAFSDESIALLSMHPFIEFDESTSTDIKPVKQQSLGFEAFWKAYPKKVGKDAAERAFGKRKPNEAMLIDMLEAIERQKVSTNWQEEGGRFIPYPASWLNKGRWKDEDTHVSTSLIPGAI
jgi:hypothetical protein